MKYIGQTQPGAGHCTRSSPLPLAEFSKFTRLFTHHRASGKLSTPQPLHENHLFAKNAQFQLIPDCKFTLGYPVIYCLRHQIQLWKCKHKQNHEISI